MKTKLTILFVFFLSTNTVFSQAGLLDTIFGNRGIVTTSINVTGSGSIRAMALQSDGKIIAAGYSYFSLQESFILARYNTDGTLDESFGLDGIAMTDVSVDFDKINAVAIQSDGKIVAAGYTETATGKDMAIVRYMPDGGIDLTFGTNGIVITDIGSHDYIESMTIQGDDKIIVAGHTFTTQADIIIARYKTDGTLDNTFATDGIVEIVSEATSDHIHSIILQSDGKIIVGGSSDLYGSDDFTLVRLNPDGTVDNLFGLNGFVISPLGSSSDIINAIALLPDGKIIAAGVSDFYGTNDFALAKYNANGTIDITFGINGAVISAAPTEDCIESIEIQSDGKIVAAGYTGSIGSYDMAMARYNSNGTVDNTFGTGGVVITDIGSTDITSATLLQDDEKILIGGHAGSGTDWDFAVIRYSTNGSLDESFGEDGIVVTEAGISTSVARSMVLQNDGKILVAGISLNETNRVIILLRYNQDGEPDQTFGTNGLVTIDTEINGEANAVTLQNDEKIVVAGSNGNDVIIVRFNSNGTLDNTFGTDGIAEVAVGPANDFANAMAIQSDGKIVAGGFSVVGPGDSDFSLTRFNSSGEIDNTFGTNGIVITPLEGKNYMNSVAIQSDGKIVAGGYSDVLTHYDFTLVRYNSNGTPDASFGTEGTVNTDFDLKNDEMNSIALQSDGKIIAGGKSSFSGNSASILVRYLSDGSIDATFGAEGVVSTSIGTYNEVNAVALQDDGKILTFGRSVFSPFQFGYTLMRFTADGIPDSSFGTDGIVNTPVGSSVINIASAIVPSNGKIVVAGTLANTETEYAVITIARYIQDSPTVNGEMDILLSGCSLLEKNYPNPFHSVTKIKYHVPVTGLVSLKVYDILGKEVSTLVNEEQPSGIYEVEFSPAGLIPGLYLYRMTISSGKQGIHYSDTKKLIIK